MFIHGGWLHIIGNMLFLWAFGKSLEDAMGHVKFLTFYLVCGRGCRHHACRVQRGHNAADGRGQRRHRRRHGRDICVKFPRARIHTLIFLLFFVTTADIPAAFILIYWFVTQLFSEYGSMARTQVMTGGVAYAAHIGGFMTGMILVQFMGVRTRYFPRRDANW